MSAPVMVFAVTAASPDDAALAARLVERHCGPDAPLVLAILGLDAPGILLPRREPGPRVTPHPYRRATTGKRPGDERDQTDSGTVNARPGALELPVPPDGLKLPLLPGAACTGYNPDLWFPRPGESPKKAKAVCRACPARVRCLEWAVQAGERAGIWGGTSPGERAQLDGRTWDQMPAPQETRLS